MPTIASTHSRFGSSTLDKISIYQLWCLSTYSTAKRRLALWLISIVSESHSCTVVLLGHLLCFFRVQQLRLWCWSLSWYMPQHLKMGEQTFYHLWWSLFQDFVYIYVHLYLKISFSNADYAFAFLSCRTDIQASSVTSSAAVHEFRIPRRALLGLHSYCPVHFDAFHSVLVDLTLHIVYLKAGATKPSLKVHRFVKL